MQRCHVFFLTPLQKFSGVVVYYSTQPVGRNTFAGMTKKLRESVLSHEGKNITNKIGRNIGTSRLDEAHVPLNKAMELIGHRDQKSFKKYCRALVEVFDRAME